MNWMTSGRKRVRRSQKSREQRAKHFAKVAADQRVLPQLVSRSDTTLAHRQSADVTRLRSRWSLPDRSAQSTGLSLTNIHNNATASPATTSTPSALLRPGPLSNATPTSLDPTVGVLNLDITPPFSSIPERPTRSSSSEVGSSIENVNQVGLSERLGSLHPVPDGHASVSSLTHTQSTLMSNPPFPQEELSRRPLPAERRRLMFGGGNNEERGEYCDKYEECPLGGDGHVEGDAIGSTGNRTSLSQPSQLGLYTTSEHGQKFGLATLSAVDEPGASSTNYSLPTAEEAARPLRFFDSGVEVAVNDSPILRRPSLITNNVANKCLLFSGVTEANAEIGFPSFGGRFLPSSCPPTLSPARQDMYFDKASAEATLHPSRDSNLSDHQMDVDLMEEPARSIEAATEPALHDSTGDSTQEKTCPTLTQADTVSVASASIAQAWGLFGGAMEEVKQSSVSARCHKTKSPQTTIVHHSPREDTNTAHEHSSLETRPWAGHSSSPAQRSSTTVDQVLYPPSQPQAPVTPAFPEQDYPGSGEDSPELSMCWEHDDMEFAGTQADRQGPRSIAPQEDPGYATFPPTGEGINDDHTVASRIVQEAEASSEYVHDNASHMTRERNRASRLEQQSSVSETHSLENWRSVNESSCSEENAVGRKNVGGDTARQIQEATTATQTLNERANVETGGDISKYDKNRRMTPPSDECTQTPPQSLQHLLGHQHPKISPPLGKPPTTECAPITPPRARKSNSGAPVGHISCYRSAGKGNNVGGDHQLHRESATVTVNTAKQFIEHFPTTTAGNATLDKHIVPQNVRTNRARATRRARSISTRAGKLVTPQQSNIADPPGAEGEMYSTVVWYRTIVACLMKAADPVDHSSSNESLR